MPRRVKYMDGSWFSVPLRDSGFGVGRICRCATPVLFGYFFGPRRESVPQVEDLSRLKPPQAILRIRFGDLGLVRGEWKLIGCTPWDQNEWLLPPFVRVDPVSGLCTLVTYNPLDVSQELSKRKASPEEIRGLPEDGLWGYGAVELTLTKLLRQ